MHFIYPCIQNAHFVINKFKKHNTIPNTDKPKSTRRLSYKVLYKTARGTTSTNCGKT